MPRRSRVVIPNLPHHVIQRGNRRQTTFFSAADYDHYLQLLKRWLPVYRVSTWSYCLMPNHVHLVLVPEASRSLARALAEVHRRYTLRINKRNSWRGHLWQGRFSSCVIDSGHYLGACVRYILTNPVRANLVSSAVDWPYSNARTLLTGRADRVANQQALLRMGDYWRNGLAPLSEEEGDELRRSTYSGRPWGSPPFVHQLEKQRSQRLRQNVRGCPTQLQVAVPKLPPR